MQTVTLSQLRSRARRRADMESTATPTDAQVDEEINNSIRRLHAKVVPLAEDQFTETVIVATVAGVRWVALPGEFLTLRAVEWLPSATPVLPAILTEGGDEIVTEAGDPIYLESGEATVTGSEDAETIERFALQSRAKYTSSTGWACDRPVAYRLVGRSSSHVGRMELVPTPTARHAVRLWYVPVAATLANDADTYDGFSGFDQWVVADVAAWLLSTEESDASACVSERENVWETQVAPLFATQDQNRPDRVIDVEAMSLEEWL